jgi:hypothetical protein
MPKKAITTEIKTASYASLLKESDKGCLLLAVGIFDKLLENILGAAILSNLNGKLPKEFLAVALFGDNGTLHMFSSKINVAHAFCLISKDEFDALHALRKLRNEAAHCYFEFSFRNPGVVAHLNKLEKYDLEVHRKCFTQLQGVQAPETETEKFDFVVRCYAVLMDLQGAYLKQVHRYATEVRGIKLPPLTAEEQ